MKLENQVCNLELSRKLEELGVGQESIWCWVILDLARNKWGITLREKLEKWEKKITKVEHFSAFTVAELGEMLPAGVMYGGLKSISGKLVNDLTSQEERITEADARAKCLIYLIENRLINPKEK